MCGAINIVGSIFALGIGTSSSSTDQADHVTMQIGSQGALVAYPQTSAVAGSEIGWSSNLYVSGGTWKSSVFADEASYIIQGGGNIMFNTACCAAAGASFNGSERMRIGRCGSVWIGPTNVSGDRDSGFLTCGLTINQGPMDNEIFALRSTCVIHGMTAKTDTDTYGFIKKYSGSQGGVLHGNYTEGNTATMFQSAVTSVDTTKSTAATGAFLVQGALKMTGPALPL